MKRLDETVIRGFVAFWIIVIVAFVIWVAIVEPMVLVGTISILAIVYLTALILGTAVNIFIDWKSRKRKEESE